MSMRIVHQLLFPVMWLTWLAYWWLASFNVKATARRESLASRLAHSVPLAIAVALLWPDRLPIPILESRFIAADAWTFWVGAALTLAGLAFTVWARLHLGKNWSAIVTVKQDHELVTTGPYAIVRHPIYTGLLLAVLGSALARGEWRGIVAVALVLWGFRRKLRIEERWMKDQFGSVYEAYAARVAALVPYVL